QALGRMADLAFNASNLAANIANQNYVGAVASGIGLIGNIFGMFKLDEASRTEQQLESINRTLERQSAILASMPDAENYYHKVNKQLEEYNNLLAENEKKLRTQTTLQLTPEGVKELGGYAYDPYRPNERFINTAEYTTSEIIDLWSKGLIVMSDYYEDTVAEIIETQGTINNLLAETWDKITGNSRESIADAIIDGFRNGYRSAEDFADNFEEIMTTAILNSFKVQMMEGPLKEWYEGFYEVAKDGLTEDEIEEQQKLWNKMVEGQKVLFDSMKEATGIDLQNSEKGYDKLTGISASLTEETGSIIAGQFTAMRFDLKAIDENTKQAVDYLMQGLAYQEQIAANTSYNKHLKTIDEELQRLNRVIEQRL
ncbi:MAG: hypothetical protein ACP5D9_11945, partial [Mariniphaga sp.]